MSQSKPYKNDNYTSNKIKELQFIQSITNDTPKDHLLKWYKEEPLKYNWRHDVSYFVDFFTPTVGATASLIFRNQPNIEIVDELYLMNIDNQGSSISSFMHGVAISAVKFGATFLMAETNLESGVAISKAEEEKLGVRGYIKQYEYNDLVSRQFSDKGVLSQIVFKVVIEEIRNEFETVQVDYYKVYRIGGGEIWKKNNNTYEKTSSWSNNLNHIPLSMVFGGQKLGRIDSKPIFKNIAELNISHLNISSGVMNIVHIASNPVPVIYGIPSNTDVTIGVNTPINFPDTTGNKFEWVEISGTSVGVAQTEITTLEEHMSKLSFSILTDNKKYNSRTITATEIANTNEKNKSVLTLITESLESGLNNCLRDMAALLGSKPIGTITLSKDFDDVKLTGEQLDKIMRLKNEGNISLDALWDMLIAGEILPKTFDKDAEKLIIDNELEKGL